MLFVGAQACAGDILVKVEGRQASGAVHLAMVQGQQKEWPEQVLRQIQSDDGVLRLRNLPAGRYAIQVYQDSNGNGRLDLSRRGIPQEPVGFSGNPSLVNGKPSPERCLFVHGSGDTELVIRLQDPKAKR
ncbi:DUF2141 domain-containing protein [Pseudomonas sp. LRF_L74]|uniref:DUF2141 domain-containing protein n=1 Tax=Pseudomonas sp. LRF_L74 TaxID=3369422 RepID=UPI003F63EC9A